MQLRDYQKQVIKEIYRWYRWGHKSVMLVSPTGSGKTLTASHIIKDALGKNCRVLFIVHREPLIDQTANTLINYGVSANQIGYIKAGYPQAQGDELVILGSIQTLARRDYPPGVGLVIFDEAHTTSFYNSAQELIYHYANSPVVALSEVFFLHLTATPYRTKAKEYFPHVQAVVKAPDIRSLIKMSYLVPARHFGYGGLLNYSKLDTGQDGDYKQSQLSIVCSEPEYNAEVVERFQKICPNRKAVAFCAGVNQSQLLTELFNQVGIVTAHIQAETPVEKRKEIFKLFKEGAVQIISTVGTLTEGFDEPSIEAVIIARPTKSLALLIQMCGRGLRLFPGKEDCWLLDFGDNFQRLGKIDQKRSISLCPSPKRGKSDSKECPNCHAFINKFLRICPECGYVFPPGSEEEQEALKDNFLPEFGELLDEEQTAKIAYIRAQRKARFTKNLNPDDLWDLWSLRYQDDILCNDWLYGAIFRGDRSTYAQQRFLSYLYSFNPNSTSWVIFHMELEFGHPRHIYESKFKGRYFLPSVSCEQLNWWYVLQVDSEATEEEVKTAYSSLAANREDDEIKLLNWAYEQFLNYKISPPFTENLNSEPVVQNEVFLWSQVIQAVSPPTTKALLSNKGRLISLKENHAQIEISSPPLIRLIQQKISRIEDAFYQVLGQKITVQITPPIKK